MADSKPITHFENALPLSPNDNTKNQQITETFLDSAMINGPNKKLFFSCCSYYFAAWLHGKCLCLTLSQNLSLSISRLCSLTAIHYHYAPFPSIKFHPLTLRSTWLIYKHRFIIPATPTHPPKQSRVVSDLNRRAKQKLTSLPSFFLV